MKDNRVFDTIRKDSFMTKQKRKEYLILTSCAFGIGALIYTVPFALLGKLTDGQNIPYAIAAIIGGIFIGATISAIILAANFFSKRGLAFKIVAVCLFPITMLATFYAGFFSFVPYYIFNIVRLCGKDNAQNLPTETNGRPEQLEHKPVGEATDEEK